MTIKKAIVCCGILLLLAGAITGGVWLTNIIIEHREQVAIVREELAVQEAYLRLNYTLNRVYVWEFLQGVENANPWVKYNILVYHPVRRGGEGPGMRLNSFGICVTPYLWIKMYELETGNVLSWETVMDYLAEEFEPDGSRRLYNNGNHPELQAYVEWFIEGRRGEQGHQFVSALWALHVDYCNANREAFEWFHFPQLSPQMLDELVKAHTNPDHTLDLTSIQQAGY